MHPPSVPSTIFIFLASLEWRPLFWIERQPEQLSTLIFTDNWRETTCFRRAITRATQRRAFQKRINFAINVTTASCDRFRTERGRRERERGRLPRVQLDEQPRRFELRSPEDDDDGVEDGTCNGTMEEWNVFLETWSNAKRYVTFIIERFHAPRNGRRDFLITASKKLELIKPPSPSENSVAFQFSCREIQFPARLRSEREFN